MKKLLALLLALFLLFSLTALFAGCEDSGKKKKSSSSSRDEDDEDEDEETEDNSDETDDGEEEETEPSQTLPGEMVLYTVRVNSIAGRAMENVDIYIYNDKELTNLISYSSTDENGCITAELPENVVYYITVANVPGYCVEEFYTFDGTTADIILTTALSNESISNVSLDVGDVMCDFTVTTPDGTDYTLSELLKEKKAVLLSFWFSSCSWCQAEFPFMEQAYQQYREDVEILALNPIGEGDDVIADYPADNGLTISFPMAECPFSWQNSFNITGYPTTIAIDRYGVIVAKEAGAITSLSPFVQLLNVLTADDYEQKFYDNVTQIVPEAEPEYTVHDAALGTGVAANCFTYNGIDNPDRTYARFVPSRSGVYRITSHGENLNGIEAYLLDGNENVLDSYGSDERLFTDEQNVSMVCYLEAGIPYLIHLQFWHPMDAGRIPYDIVYLGESYTMFRRCAEKYFGYDDEMNLTVNGIDVTLADDGFYYQDMGGGRLGSMIYVDFVGNTVMSMPITSDDTYNLIKMGGFKFDNADQTAAVKAYLEDMIQDGPEELIGCVPLTAELAEILQKLMDVYTFEGIADSWRMMCYYYDEIG